MLLLVLGCLRAPLDSAEDTTPPAPGTLALSFGIDDDYLAMMQEPAVGTFYGTFWRGDEVMGFGPVAGAEDLDDFEVNLDLQNGPTEILFESSELPAIEVWSSASWTRTPTRQRTTESPTPRIRSPCQETTTSTC